MAEGGGRERFELLDIAGISLFVLALGFGIAGRLGDRWTGQISSGERRIVPVVVTVEVTEPVLRRLALELESGPFVAETHREPEAVEILSVEAGAGRVVLSVRVDGRVDELDRLFWSNRRLMVGGWFLLADGEREVGGVVVDLRRDAGE